MNKRFKNKPNTVHQLPNGHVWHSRSCVVIAHVHVLINDAKGYFSDEDIYILAGKRGSGKHKGKYNVPTGYLDWSEDIEHAVYRELWEEAGIYLPDYEQKMLLNTRNSPWMLVSDPKVTLQNVLFQSGIVLEFDSVNDLPAVNIDNMEPNECENIEWIKFSDFKAMPHDNFCFNHFTRTLEFNEHYTKILKGKGLM
jgi:8-oxo-dGTP pyrophosphatase MutT (NUDIX family)